MPVAKGPSFDLRSAAIFGGVAVVAAIVIGVVAIQLGTRSNTFVLGSTDFGELSVDGIAESIDEGGPLLLPDVASGSRDIWLQHVGDDLGTGWSAFDVRRPGESRDCFAEWEPSEQAFVHNCDGTIFPENGEGLPQIGVFIDVRELIIDLNDIHEESDFAGFVEG